MQISASRPGSIQARGDNLVSVVRAFANSSMLRNAYERLSLRDVRNASDDEKAVFFDYFTLFLVRYALRIGD